MTETLIETMILADLQHHIALAADEPNLSVRSGTLHLLFSEVMGQFHSLPTIDRNAIPIHLPDQLAQWREKQTLINEAVDEVGRL